MKLRLFISLLVVFLMGAASVYSNGSNVMVLHDLTAPAGTVIAVELEIVNDDEFVGFNLDIPFPEGFTYVPGSAQLFRHDGHQLSFTVPHSNTARIIAFSFMNAAFIGNEGTILTFQLETPNAPGEYVLPIVDPIIGNIDAQNILTGTVDGTITLQGDDPEPEYTLSLFANPPAGGTVTGGGNYEAGAQVTAAANANAGYDFANWTDVSGNVLSTQASYVFQMPDADLSLWANFEEDDDPIPSGENIMMMHDVSASAGDVITLELEIVNDDEFVGFNLDVPLPAGFEYIDGTAQLYRGIDHGFVINVIESTNLVKIIAFSITNTPFLGNDGIIFSFDVATPDTPGVYPVPVLEAVIGNAEAQDILTGTVDGTVTLTEGDEPGPEYMLSLFANPPAGGTVTGAGNYEAGTMVTASATSNTGYEFVNWTDVSGNVISTQAFYSFTMPDADLSLWANFEEDDDPEPGDQNVMIIHDVTAPAGEIITVEIEIVNDNPFVGFNLDIPFPEGFTYVPGSAQLFRHANHQLSFTVPHSNTARIIAFSFTNAEFSGNEGTVLTFQLETPATPGDYLLPIVDPIIGNIDAVDILTGTVDGTVTLEEVIPDPEYALTLLAEPEEGGTLSGAGEYTEGTEVFIEAIPNTGYYFIHWTDEDGNTVSDDATTIIEMPAADLTLTAHFGLAEYNLNLLVNPDDGGTVTGAGTYNYGEEAVVNAEPNTGWMFVNWTDVDGNPVYQQPENTIVITGDLTLIANFDMVDYHLILIADPEDGGTVNGSGIYNFQDEVDIDAAPNEGWHFVNWTDINGNIISDQASSTIEMPAEDLTLIANFAMSDYTLTLLAQPAEGGTVTGGGVYNFGNQVEVDAIPNEGWHFVNWTDSDGNVVSGDSFNVIEMPAADLSLTANFELSEFTVTVYVEPEDAGVVSGEGVYDFGEEVTLMAFEETGYEFISWNDPDGNELGTDHVYTFLMPAADVEITAHFALIDYLVSVAVEPEGAATVSGAGYYNFGDQVTLQAQPGQGYEFVNWTSPDGDELSDAAIYTFNMPAVDVMVFANFELTTYSLNVNIIGNGSVDAEPDQDTYLPGTPVELTAIPDPGWIFNNWTGAYNGFNNPVTIVMNADKSITARFIQLFVTNVVVSGPGYIAIPEDETVSEQYTATVFNQFNQPMPDEDVSWSTLPDHDDLPGVSIDDNGVLSISPDAEEDDILVIATSASNPNVFGVRMVELEEIITKYTLTLNISGNGAVHVNGASYSSSTQNIELEANEMADLLASPASGWSFTNWTGDVIDPDAPETSVFMDGNKTISVHFSQDQYFLTIEIEGNGSVSKIPNLEFYAYNQPVILRAVAASGWIFSHWTGDVVNPNNASTYIIMNEDKELTAHFVQLPVTLTIDTEGNGIVIADPSGPTYDPGTQVVLTAEASIGWEFSHWVGDVADEEAEITTISMDESKTVTAHFVEAAYLLNVEVEGNGSVALNPDEDSYAYGQPVILRAIPAAGWAFSHWTGNVLDNNAQRTAVLMTEDQDITAHFVQLGYTLTVNLQGNGTVDINPDLDIYEPGTQVTLFAEQLGPGFIYWTGAYNGFNNPITITMNGNRNITAHFYEWDVKDLNQMNSNPYILQDGVGDIFIGGPGQVLIPGAGEDANQQQYIALVVDETGSALPDEDVIWSISGPDGIPLIGLSIDPDSGILSVASDAFFPVIGVVATSVSNPDLSQTRIVSLVNEITLYSLGLFVNGTGSVGINGNDYTDFFQNIELDVDQLYDIIADPGNHWSFLSWSGDLEGENPEAELLMDDHKTVVANFAEDQYYLMVNISGGGSVNVNPDAESYPYGELVNVTAVANPGWAFSHWTGDVLNPDAASTIVIMDADKTVEAVFEQLEYVLTVNVAGEGIVLKAPDQDVYFYGDEVVLTAAPSDGWMFDGWTGGVVSPENPVTVIMNGNKTVLAHFSEIPLIPSDISITGEEEVIIPLPGHPAAEIQYSAEIFDQFGESLINEDVIWTLTGNAPAGVDISVNGLLSVSSQALPVTIGIMATSVSEPDLFDILFVELIRETVTITAQPNNPDFGSVDGAGDYLAGSQVVLTAMPEIGYHLVNWTENGESVFGEAVYTFIAEENRDLIANFSINTYIITATSGENGSIDPAGDIVVEHGADQSFAITPDEGYHIAEVLVNGVDVGALAEYAFEDVTENHSIHAVFAINTYIIAATSGDHGSIDPAGDIVVEHGAGQSFTITPNEGYHIAEVLVNGVDVGAVAEYAFENVTEDQSIHAVFAINTYIITATSGNNGSINPAGDIVVEHGADQSFTITPNEGYHIADVFIDGVSVGPLSEYTFDNVTDDHTIHADFELTTYLLTFVISDAESAESITDAIITIDGVEYAEGMYVFESLPPGNYEYAVSREGYHTYEGEVDIIDQDVVAEVELDPLDDDDDTSVVDAELLEVMIFPNPANSILTIEANVIMKEVRLIDLLGRVVYLSDVQDHMVMINVSGFDQGIYFLQINTISGLSTHRIQIKQ